MVGHAAGYGGIQMSWIDDCAYLAGGDGVAVIDVSDPTAPHEVARLRDKGSKSAGETFHALKASDGRGIIAAGNYYGGYQYGPDPNGTPWLDIYDASDCKHPKLAAELAWPENIHTLRISPNGKRLYGTHIEPFTGYGGIHVMDITDLENPVYMGRFGATGSGGSTWDFASHNIVFNDDETRIYVGVIASRGGDINKDIPDDGKFTAQKIGRDAGGVYIFDNSDIVNGLPNPVMRLVGTVEDAGWHDPTKFEVEGTPYLVAAGELGTCPGTWPRTTDISDEMAPVIIGEFRLDTNREENCPPDTDPNAFQGGTSSHYSSVDRPTDTRFGMFNMMDAGIRFADLREPTNPTEVAYFRPGDPCSGFARFVPETGHIWFACLGSGFWVVKLTDDVMNGLGP